MLEKKFVGDKFGLFVRNHVTNIKSLDGYIDVDNIMMVNDLRLHFIGLWWWSILDVGANSSF